MNWNRRRVISTAVMSLLTPGCTSTSISNGRDDIAHCESLPDDPPPPARCTDDSFTRLQQRFPESILTYGSLRDEAFDLSLSMAEPEVNLGQELEITLTNNADEPVDIGPFSNYDIQQYTSEGWWNVRGYRGAEPGMPQPAQVFEPGATYTWTFEATAEGFSDELFGLEVCPELTPGRYRFVYLGLITSDAIGICFELTK